MNKYVRLTSLGAALAAIVTAAGCAGGPTVYWDNVTSGYWPGIVNYSAARGGMLAEVVGNPFAAPKSDLDAAVLETARDSHFGPPLPFFTQAPEGYNLPYKVVFVMNPVPGTGGFAVCRGEAQTRPRGPSEPDRVYATLCSGNVNLSSASGGVAGPLGPRDPAFLGLIADLTFALFPPESPEDRQDDGRILLKFMGQRAN